MNDREIDTSLTWFNALIITDWDKMNWEGDPDIIPVDGLNDKPIGSDPEMIENEISSPLTEGMIENGLFFFRI